MCACLNVKYRYIQQVHNVGPCMMVAFGVFACRHTADCPKGHGVVDSGMSMLVLVKSQGARN